MIKYLTPASEEEKSSLLKATKMYNDRLCNSKDINKDSKSFDETIKSIPIIEVNKTIENSGL